MKEFENTIIDRLEDLTVMLIHHQIYLGPIIFLSIEELGIPLPVPGDLIIAYTGYEISQKHISYIGAYFILLAAIILGSSGLYFISRKYGQGIVLKLGKYLHLDEKKLQIVEEKFRKYGIFVIIFGRHIPGFRIPITVFAGISKISYKKFLLGELISITAWIAIYLYLGERLGAKTLIIFQSLNWRYFVAIIALLIVLFFFLIYLGKKRNTKNLKT